MAFDLWNFAFNFSFAPFIHKQSNEPVKFSIEISNNFDLENYHRITESCIVVIKWLKFKWIENIKICSLQRFSLPFEAIISNSEFLFNLLEGEICSFHQNTVAKAIVNLL